MEENLTRKMGDPVEERQNSYAPVNRGFSALDSCWTFDTLLMLAAHPNTVTMILEASCHS